MKKTLTIITSIFTLLASAQVQKNKLYFTSNSNINPLNIKASEVKTNFSITDNIYAFMVSDKPIKEILPNDQRFFWLQTKKSPQLKEIRFRTLEEHCLSEETYFVFPIMLQKDEKEYYSNDAFEAMQHLSSLPTGSNIVKVMLKEEGEVKIAGNFTLEILPKTDAISLAKKINPNRRKGKGYLKFGMKQADIEDEILELFQETYPDKGFKRVIITSKKYYYKRDNEYNVTARFLDADILTNSGGKCKAYDITVKQDKFGQNYGTLEEAKVNGFYSIDCQGL